MKRATISVEVQIVQYEDEMIHYQVRFPDSASGTATFSPVYPQEAYRDIGKAIVLNALNNAQ